MKNFHFVCLALCAIMFSFPTQCMLLGGRNQCRLLLPAQKRRCSDQIKLHHKINSLENKLQLYENECASQRKELAEIKAIVGRWNNDQSLFNSQNSPSINNAYIGSLSHDDSFIDEHNMHYENRAQP